jgi:putative ABC transport system permease protein
MPVAFDRAVTPDYARALGLGVRRGRDLAETDALGTPGAVLVNETFVRRYFPHEDPIGKYLAPGRATQPVDAVDRFGVSIWSQIVGVVSDMTSLTAQPEVAPEIYRSYWQWPMQTPMLFIRTTGDPAALADTLRREVKATIPALPPPKIRLMTERVSESIAQPRFQAALLNLFSGIGLLLAAVGIYGVLAYGVAQRQRELGIRIALGAQRRDVFALVIGHGMRLAALGVALGLGAAAAITRLLRSQFYEMQPLDPLTFGLSALALLAVALGACWFPARAATRVDPMVALRAE